MNAASRLNVLKDFNLLFKGVKSFLSKPYRQGIVILYKLYLKVQGTAAGTKDLSIALASTALRIL
jgi:hypothetical protein